MSNAKTQPLTDMERFEILQAMFPDLLDEEKGADIGDEEEIIFDKFDMEPEQFDRLVGHLVMLAPAMGSPLSGKAHHVLGRVTITDGQMHIMAAVKREAIIQAKEEEPTT